MRVCPAQPQRWWLKFERLDKCFVIFAFESKLPRRGRSPNEYLSRNHRINKEEEEGGDSEHLTLNTVNNTPRSEKSGGTQSG